MSVVKPAGTPVRAESARPVEQGVVSTRVPARLERLPWGRFHSLVVVALGVTWILDGLEVTMAGSVSGALRASPTLGLGDAAIGFAGSAYVFGAVCGALGFGWLTDRLGRRPLFFTTIAVYLVATALSGLAWSAGSFFLFRFLTGCGIGGEYAAVNSTIQELVPARFRGFVDLLVNGSFWVGAALGAIVAVVLLNPSLFNPDVGWRFAFFVGAALGVVVFFMRMWIPESPRWLAIHGRAEEADAVVSGIEDRFISDGAEIAPVEVPPVRLRSRSHTPLGEVVSTILRVYPRRAFLGLTLMAAQAFFYNAIFFTYALVLTKFYAVPADRVGWYILPFAIGNFLGPLVLGRLFDTLGRRRMLTITYALSGILLIGCGVLFEFGVLSAFTQTLGWMLVFFFASPAASAAYLTVSENFPIEIRALTIAIFYAVGTGVGGAAAPFLFGLLIASGSRESVFAGYVVAALLMLVGALVAALFAVDAERRPLEEVATPLSAEV
ncbi:MAG: MFS transporter [Hyphomicrobiales bacterium]|nr:MFS transporter [Hyphomicrobiales bacterium]MBV8663639.1 MFS transporter [Hyphomicrobiales bacterium]